MKLKTIMILSAAAVMLTGCGKEKEAAVTEAVTSETATETTFNQYAAVRSFAAQELLDSVFYYGEYRPMPYIPDESLKISDGVMTFPDGTWLYAVTDEEGKIVSIKLERGAAPTDFSVFGVDFNSFPNDVYDKLGIPENAYGNEDTQLTLTFTGGGISELTFVFTERVLTEVSIRV
ncbi:MAG: hypothetical protein J6C96_08495 [Oscillospiraceae bacterium]|nr:hypothetical protein [Oscillospiraceae bacterium]